MELEPKIEMTIWVFFATIFSPEPDIVVMG
jgi:hypothetical protein